MKKSLIALAVAGAFASPAFAATSNVDVYGVLNISVEDSDVDNVDMQVTSRQSYIGFKGSEDLGGGLKAIWQIETAIDSTPAGSDGVGGSKSIANRNTFVGLSGTWGTALMGRHDTPYKLSTAPLDPFADTIGDWNGNYSVDTSTTTVTAPTLGMVGVDLLDNVHDHRSPSAIAYISPTWDGFHFAAAVVATNSTVLNDVPGDTIDAYSLAAVYSNGPIYIGAGYQDVSGQLNSDAWKIGGSYAFGDFKVGGVYENVGTGFAGDRDSWLVNGTWTMGAIVLKAEYGAVDYKDINVDGTKWVVGADYNLSKRTKAFLVYTSDDVDASGSNDDLDSAGWAIGVKHSF